MIRKKIIIIITTIILTATFSIKNVSAVDFNMSFYNPNPCTTCTYEAQPNEIEPYRQGYNQYHCEYFDNLYRTRKISLNAYDEQGRTIIPYSKLSLVKFKSGTWMGINVREKKLSSWDIQNRKYHEDVYIFNCSTKLNADGQAVLSACSACAACAAAVSACATACTSSSGHCSCSVPPQCITIARSCPSAEQCAAAASCVMEDAGTEHQPYYYTEIENNRICGSKDTAYCDGIVRLPMPTEPTTIDIAEVKSCTAKMIHKTVNKAVNHVLYATLQIDIILDKTDYSRQSLEIKSFTNSRILIDESKREDEAISSMLTNGNFDKIKDGVEDPSGEKTKLPTKDFLDKLEAAEANDSSITTTDLEPLLKGEYHSLFEYTPDHETEENNVCINVKTGNIYYNTKNKYSGSTNNDCVTQKNIEGNRNNIKEIKDGETYDEGLNETVDYWHYFIPLETHTTDATNKNDIGFYLGVTDGSEMEGDFCTQIMEDFPIQEGLSENEQMIKYSDFIRPAVDQSFVSDYTGDNIDAEDYQLVKENGCYFSVQTRFNIEQKFYGEIEKIINGNKRLVLKGYSFYYRPIDINKPFPNPIASDSTWKGLYNAENNKIVEENTRLEVDLSKSFDNITYTTKEVSLREIRQKTTSEGEYTSWKYMNQNGTSGFISELGLRKNISLNSLYKLGCGPDNLDWAGCTAGSSPTEEGEDDL